MDQFSLGPVPAEEDCAQVGSPNYAGLGRAECRRYIDLLRTRFGNEPEGARFRITSNQHDCGNYYDVVIEFDPSRQQAIDYAYKVEKEAPATWDG